MAPARACCYDSITGGRGGPRANILPVGPSSALLPLTTWGSSGEEERYFFSILQARVELPLARQAEFDLACFGAFAAFAINLRQFRKLAKIRAKS